MPESTTESSGTGLNINYSIEKLDGSGLNSNFTFWKFRATQILEEKDVWDVVKNDPPFSGNLDPKNSDHTAWKKKDRLAATIITGLVKDSQLKFITNCKTAKEIWEIVVRLKPNIYSV